MPRPALLLVLVLAACAEEAKDDKVCDSGEGTSVCDVGLAEALVATARAAASLPASSTHLNEATAAYRAAIKRPGANRTRIWSVVGLLHMDFYLAVSEVAAETGMPQDRLLHGHMKEAYAAFRAVTRELGGTGGEDWRRLAATQEDLCLASLLDGKEVHGARKPPGEREWQAVAESYAHALTHLPRWTHGWKRLSTLVDEHRGPDGALLSTYADGLAVLDHAVEMLPLADHREWSLPQRQDVYWMRSAASAMHAERGSTAKAIELVDGIGRAKVDDTIDTLPLNGERLLRHYSAPWATMLERADTGSQQPEEPLVTAWADVLSPKLFANLQAGFRVDSPYWMVGGTRAGYQGDYYSHWLDLSEEPTNAIHQALLQVTETLSPEDRKTIAGIEWWAHRRPFRSAGAKGSAEFDFRTRFLNHHLHYDTDDVVVEEDGDWHHPEISSVLYLTDGSGPTLIVNQTRLELLDPSAISALVTPRQNLFAHFKGDLLHTVLPPEAPAPERVAIAIAFWGKQHVCKQRLFLECVNDRIAELPQLAFHWQAEFPLLGETEIGLAGPTRVTSTQLRVEGTWG